MRTARPDLAPSSHTSPPLGPWAGAARFVRPGTRGAPSPARSLCSRRRSPRGRSEGRGGEGAPARPRRLLCLRPRPPALPPGRPECRAGNKGAAGPRQGGAQGPRGGCPGGGGGHFTRRPDLGGLQRFFSGESRCGERWVGGRLHKAGGWENGPSRFGEERPGAASRPMSAYWARPPAGDRWPRAGPRRMESAPRGRWVGGHGTPAPPAGRGLCALGPRALVRTGGRCLTGSRCG